MNPFIVTATRDVWGITSTITKAVRADDMADAYCDFWNWLGMSADCLEGWDIHVHVVSEAKWGFVYEGHNESPV